MLTTHKAIQTRYKGYRFRSRLEARWAVFFDAADIQWKYEPEGYDLSEYSGTLDCQHEIGKYLPDFFLPGLNLWVEIKPCLPEEHFCCTAEEDRLCALERHTGIPAVIFFGLPDVDTPASTPSLDEVQFNCADWAKVTRHLYAYIFQLTRSTTQCLDACDAARSARFEFGESGAK